MTKPPGVSDDMSTPAVVIRFSLRVIALGALNANSELDDLPVDVWLALRTKVLEAMKSDTTRYGDIARYYLTPGSDRPVRPGSKITCRRPPTRSSRRMPRSCNSSARMHLIPPTR